MCKRLIGICGGEWSELSIDMVWWYRRFESVRKQGLFTCRPDNSLNPRLSRLPTVHRMPTEKSHQCHPFKPQLELSVLQCGLFFLDTVKTVGFFLNASLFFTKGFICISRIKLQGWRCVCLAAAVYFEPGSMTSSNQQYNQ